jgi:hypothetical protein
MWMDISNILRIDKEGAGERIYPYQEWDKEVLSNKAIKRYLGGFGFFFFPTWMDFVFEGGRSAGDMKPSNFHTKSLKVCQNMWQKLGNFSKKIIVKLEERGNQKIRLFSLTQSLQVRNAIQWCTLSIFHLHIIYYFVTPSNQLLFNVITTLKVQ